MNWADPASGWLVLLGIPAAILLRRAVVRGRQAMRQLTGDGAVPPVGPARARQRVAFLLPAAAFLLLIAALCRPQWGHVAVERQSTGLDILVALDVSRSMLADDLPPNRLAVAKRALQGLLPKLPGDRIGLIAFAGSAFMVCPLTSDYGTFDAALAETGADTLPLAGTRLAAALIEARRAFGEGEGRGKFLIVISDGEDHGGEVAAAAEALRGAGVTVHSVAVGTPAGGLIPLRAGEFHRNREGAIVSSRLHAEPLRVLATATGGRLFDLAADARALNTLFDTELAGRKRRELRGTRQQLAERFQLPLALALFLLLIEPFAGGRRAP
jgi:Ca-activated chloride channel family protein